MLPLSHCPCRIGLEDVKDLAKLARKEIAKVEPPPPVHDVLSE
jgi:hypothetical protein